MTKSLTDSLVELAGVFLGGKLVNHRSHHVVTGPSFFADHAFFGELYASHDEAFDSVMERVIGLGGKVDHGEVLDAARDIFDEHDVQLSPAQLFVSARELEFAVQSQVQQVLASNGATDGLQNLLQGLADDSEVRLYKINQRLGDQS